MTRNILRAAAVAIFGVALSIGGTAWAQAPEVPQAPVPDAPVLPAPPEGPDEVEEARQGGASGSYVACQTAGSGPGTVSSAASLASLGISLLGSYSPTPLPGVGIPSEVYGYIALTQYPCAYSPSPAQISHCSSDRQIDGVVDTVYDETGAGFATIFAPVNLPKLGPVLDLALELERLAADATGAAPAISPAELAYDLMACEDVLAGVGASPLPSMTPSHVDGSATAPQHTEFGTAGAPSASSTAPTTPSSAGRSDLTDQPTVAAEIAAPTAILDTPATAGSRWQPWRIVALSASALSLLALWVFTETRLTVS